MNQQKWSFVDTRFNRQEVGIAHSPTSGHLVIYINNNISQVDFSVLSHKEYTFYLEEELCVFTIKGNQIDGFVYNFEIDTETETPLNKSRNQQNAKEQKKDRFKIKVLVIGVVSIVLGSFIGLFFFNQKMLPKTLLKTGFASQASTISSGELEFIGSSRGVRGYPLAEDRKVLEQLSPEVGERIFILYDSNNPDLFIIDWRSIFEAKNDTIARIKLQRLLQDKFPQDWPSAACVLRRAGDLGGFDAQKSLIDAFILNDIEELEKWKNHQKKKLIVKDCLSKAGR